MNKSLKKIIDNEILNVNIINNNINIIEDISNCKGNHIYNSKNIFICPYNGKFTFEFDNTNAWYWNKNIKLKLKVNYDSIDNSKLYENNYKNNDNVEIELLHNGENEIDFVEHLEETENILITDNFFLIKNVSTKKELYLYLNKNDVLEWEFEICNKNSIDFKLTFQINYLNVLKNSLDKIDNLNNTIQNNNNNNVHYINYNDLNKKYKKIEEKNKEFIHIINKLNKNNNELNKNINELNKNNNELNKNNDELNKKIK